MRVVATDEYGRHILQGLLHVDMNEKNREEFDGNDVNDFDNDNND